MEHPYDIQRLAIEYWRMQRMATRLLQQQPPNAARQQASQLRYSARQVGRLLSAHGLELIDHDGDAYSPNLPVTVMNKEDFSGQPHLRISQTLEPTVMYRGNVVELGRVLVELPVPQDEDKGE